MNNDEVRGIVVEVIDPRDRFAEVEAIWKELAVSSEHSFFLSWAWIGVWVSCLPTEQDIRLVVGRRKNRVVLAFFLGLVSSIENRIIYARRAYLNSTGVEKLDAITIEYNGMLMARDSGLDLEDVLNSSQMKSIEEFVFPNVTSRFANLLLENSQNYWQNKLSETNSHYVDLQKVRDSDCDILKLLSKNRRAQIRKSIRFLETNGSLTSTEASSKSEFMSMFSELSKLHNDEWEKRGTKGAFTNDFFLKFHKQLIESSFDDGVLSILKISSPIKVVGYLYCFVFERKVIFYQCGFNYEQNNQIQPGLVCNCMAINYYAEKGFEDYDFLKGDSQYKKSLSTDARSMSSFCLQKKNPKFLVESILRSVKNGIEKKFRGRK